VSSKRRAEFTREDILDATWDLIAARGTEVSMADIARASGISRQAVYLHFASRGGLLMALVKRADDRFRIREAFFEGLQATDPRTRLEACLDAWFDFVPRIHPVARDLIRLRAADPDARAAWEDRMADLRSWLRQLVDSLAADGALAPGWTADAATDTLWSVTSVQIWDLLVGDRGRPPTEATALLKRTATATLLADPTD